MKMEVKPSPDTLYILNMPQTVGNVPWNISNPQKAFCMLISMQNTQCSSADNWAQELILDLYVMLTVPYEQCLSYMQLGKLALFATFFR